MVPEKQKSFILPYSIVTMSDISKLMYEVDSVNNFFMQAKARTPGSPITPPKMSPEMEDVLRQNELNLLVDDDRIKLKSILDTLRTKSPTIHMSFSVSPSQRFLEKIIAWMRTNINPLIILQVGLQPNIGSGFTMRTNNHFFDMSLRQYMQGKSNLLLAEIRKENGDDKPN